MLYSEFVTGTGCRENEHNYSVYERVNRIYNSDDNMTHEEAYEIAKLWIDNSLSAEEEQKNRETEAQIVSLQDDNEQLTREIQEIQQEIRELRERAEQKKHYKRVNNDMIAGLKSCIIK